MPIWLKTEEELGAINLPPPFWAFAWAGGQALARYTLDNPMLFTARRVLDLGTGSGLTAIAAKKAGAAHVVAADIDPVALAATALNANENGVTVETTSVDLLGGAPGDFDVILLGDLFYERALAERVMRFVTTARDQSALVLVGDPQRDYFPTGEFTMAVSYQVAVTRELEDALVKTSAVWRL